jgi:hypothetical protein
VADKRFGWASAQEQAAAIVKTGSLSREQHLEAFRKFLQSANKQDQMIAVALLELFLKNYPDDFDRNISLDNLVEWGGKVCEKHWKEYGRAVLLQVMRSRSIPAEWIDKVADETNAPVRKAFALALGELAKKKGVKLERILGVLEYFLDDPDPDVRDILLVAFEEVSKRDPERLHYYMTEFERGAGSFRLALFKAVRDKLKEQQEAEGSVKVGEEGAVESEASGETEKK